MIFCAQSGWQTSSRTWQRVCSASSTTLMCASRAAASMAWKSFQYASSSRAGNRGRLRERYELRLADLQKRRSDADPLYSGILTVSFEKH